MASNRGASAEQPEGFGRDLFLSHNGLDKPMVRELAAMLKRAGLSVWLDEMELQPGIPWVHGLESGIRDSRAAAVLVGPHGSGPWQDVETNALLEQAVRENRPVIPVLLPGVGAEPELPLFLRGRTWVDLREGFTDEGIGRIYWGATGKKVQSGTNLVADVSSEPAVDGVERVADSPDAVEAHHAVTFHELTGANGGASDEWIEQEAIDELLRCAPSSDRSRLERLLGKGKPRPKPSLLVAGLAKSLDPDAASWPDNEKRRAFARAAEVVIRRCLGSVVTSCCCGVPIQDAAPVNISLRTEALAEILMAGAQERAPLWKKQVPSAPPGTTSYASLRAMDLFYTDLDGDPGLEPGPDPGDSIEALEARLYERIYGPGKLYDSRRHRESLHGEITSASNMGRRLYARVDGQKNALKGWRGVTKGIPGITILVVFPSGDSTTVEEETLASALRRFYIDCAPELLQPRNKEAV